MVRGRNVHLQFYPRLASILMPERSTWKPEGSLISKLAGIVGQKRAKHRGGSKFRTKVNQEADPKLQPEDAHAACVACVVPQFITWLALLVATV